MEFFNYDNSNTSIPHSGKMDFIKDDSNTSNNFNRKMELDYEDSNTSFAYEVFMYQEQLRNARAWNHQLSKTKSKIQLTTKLIKEKKANLIKFSMKELIIYNRQLDYKVKLNKEIRWEREEAFLSYEAEKSGMDTQQNYW